MTALTRADVNRIVAEARAAGRRADLWGANLRFANLGGADLWRANLRFANLWRADIRGANIRGADLRGADLRRADIRGANLRGANLRGANLVGANLRFANLRGAIDAPAVLQVAGLSSGDAILMPRPDGWELRVGCWTGTPDLLEDLIAGDDGWPEARGDECARRRPGLRSLIGLCRIWITDHPDAIAAETKRLADFEKAQAEKAA